MSGSPEGLKLYVWVSISVVIKISFKNIVFCYFWPTIGLNVSLFVAYRSLEQTLA